MCVGATTLTHGGLKLVIGHFILEFGTCPCMFGWLIWPYTLFGTKFSIVRSGEPVYGVP